MLCFAHHYRPQLNDRYKDILNDPYYKWYFCNGFQQLELEIDSDTWRALEMVSVDGEGKVVGYLAANLSRHRNIVTSLEALNFEKDSLVFARDFYRFLSSLFEEHSFRKVRFSACVENPANEMYRRVIKRYGGRVVGIRKEEDMTPDGKVYDAVLYEITRAEYENSRT